MLSLCHFPSTDAYSSNILVLSQEVKQKTSPSKKRLLRAVIRIPFVRIIFVPISVLIPVVAFIARPAVTAGS